MKKFLLTTIALNVLASTSFAFNNPVTIQDQGSFFAGGKMIQTPGVANFSEPRNPAGQTLHGDSAYVFYQIPVNARKIPLIFLHGYGQSGKSWETTPDGRDGFQNIFLERRFKVYIVDQPRRGRAGNSTTGTTINPTTMDQLWATNFRISDFQNNLFEGVQFPEGDYARDQFFKQMTPDTGSYDNKVITDSMSALFDTIGDGILVTHSAGGDPGWMTAMQNSNVRAVVAYEPGGGFAFPIGEEPAEMESSSPFGNLKPNVYSVEQFERLTKIPIILYFGDNIPSGDKPLERWELDNWRVRLNMARLFVDAVNRHGGNATLIHLPEVGIYGNDHFLFADRNNVELADLLSDWLRENQLDE